MPEQIDDHNASFEPAATEGDLMVGSRWIEVLGGLIARLSCEYEELKGRKKENLEALAASLTAVNMGLRDFGCTRKTEARRIAKPRRLELAEGSVFGQGRKGGREEVSSAFRLFAFRSVAVFPLKTK